MELPICSQHIKNRNSVSWVFYRLPGMTVSSFFFSHSEIQCNKCTVYSKPWLGDYFAQSPERLPVVLNSQNSTNHLQIPCSLACSDLLDISLPHSSLSRHTALPFHKLSRTPFLCTGYSPCLEHSSTSCTRRTPSPPVSVQTTAQ